MKLGAIIVVCFTVERGFVKRCVCLRLAYNVAD